LEGRIIYAQKKSEQLSGYWRRLQNEELHNLYSSPNFISMIKSRRMRWTEHVSLIEEVTYAYSILVVKPEGKRIRKN